MADRIENGMIAWRAEKPWHGKGVEVGDTWDNLPFEQRIEKWLEASKLNYKVERRCLAMRNTHGEGLLTETLKNYRAIVRQDTDEVYQIATCRYAPLQNREIVGFFEEYCESGDARIETVGAIDGGRKVWALAKLGEHVIGTQDKAIQYLLMASSHDGSLQTVAKGTDVYVVCWNTLSGALGLTGGRGERLGKKETGEFRMKHTRKFGPAEKARAKAEIAKIIATGKERKEICERLAKVEIDGKGRVEFVKRLIGGEGILEQVMNDSAVPEASSGLLDVLVEKHMASAGTSQDDLKRLGKSILDAMTNSPGCDLPERRNTLWGAVNGVTYFVDHERGRTDDARLSSAWFGDGDRMKRDSVRVALEIAGIRA